ncbi:MAG: aminotransferase class IV [Bacteroidales bacterium]|jgi:4-amino-4-deoxychorismate lyase|nr:aminotransferase class IV [Bacteroidales bacterium]
MSRFLESIYVKNGIAPLISYHQARYEACVNSHYPKVRAKPLSDLLKQAPKDNIIYKLRILYSEKIEQVEFIPYKQRNITALQIIEDNSIDYHWKYADRHVFYRLKAKLQPETEIIIAQNGFLTDSSYSNLIFEKDGKLYTPSTPLLNGVQRQYLLDNNIITTRNIHVSTIGDYESIRLINAMQDIANCKKLKTDLINRNYVS